MIYDPNNHHRRSIRLKGYDYSCEGLYFITICCQDRICRFGYIENKEMILNDAGKMIGNWYYELENKFPDIKYHEMIIMPNHIHFIIENIGSSVGANLCVRPNENLRPNETVRSDNNINVERNNVQGKCVKIEGEHDKIEGEHAGSPLRGVIQWFKTMTTNEYIRGVKKLGWEPFDGKLWQRNYYEHIIRNENSYMLISEYINNNPGNWIDDKLFVH